MRLTAICNPIRGRQRVSARRPSSTYTKHEYPSIWSADVSTTMAPVKTRFLILSDTHSAVPLPAGSDDDIPFRAPLPKADVLLHCGDLTMVGHLHEYEKALTLLESIDADLKLVIAGNHDISLDENYFRRRGEYMHGRGGYDPELPKKARELWTGERARRANVAYLEEGTQNFMLKNGAKLAIYTSPFQPEFCDWAFATWRNQDRFNPPHQCTKDAVSIVENPVPDFAAVDVMMTHGPPMGILDATTRGENVGCTHLLRAAQRCRPRLHCFGHIHEGWGAQRIKWKDGDAPDENVADVVQSTQTISIDHKKAAEDRAALIDCTGDSLEFGQETLMVNASIMTFTYKPWNAPWLVDLDLERAT